MPKGDGGVPDPSVVLPRPGGGAAKSGQAMFARFMEVERRRRQKDGEAAADETTRPAQPSHPQRTYDLARQTLARVDPEFVIAPAEDLLGSPAAAADAMSSEGEQDSGVAPTPSRAGEPQAVSNTTGWRETLAAGVPPLFTAALESARSGVVAEGAPSRPPVGAPAVRPSIEEKAETAEGTQARAAALIEKGAAGMMSVDAGDDGVGFDIAFSDHVFRDLRCRITIADSVVTAIFFAPDNDTRRLLEAEAGRLRVSLEERGLRVSSVTVQMV